MPIKEDENPFRPDGKLSREVDELLRNSVITRTKCVIPLKSNGDAGNEVNTTDRVIANCKPSLVNNKRTSLNPNQKQNLTVHFSPIEKRKTNIILEDQKIGNDDHFSSNNKNDSNSNKSNHRDTIDDNNNNAQEILVESAQTIQPLYAEKIKIKDEKLCCSLF